MKRDIGKTIKPYGSLTARRGGSVFEVFLLPDGNRSTNPVTGAILRASRGNLSMAQRKPEEQTTFDQVLKLVENLGMEAQEQLIEEMKLQ
jgi:hypothetical protein